MEGSPRQLGEQYGALIVGVYERARRAVSSSKYWRYARRPWPFRLLDVPRNLRLLRGLRRSLGRAAGAAEYIAGICSVPGIGVGMLEFLVLSEVLGADRSRIAQGLGCSGVMLGGDSEGLVGKNFDYQYPLAPFQAILVRKEIGRLPYVAFAPLVMPFGGQLCMNCRGLTVSYNYAYSREGNYPGGLPASYLIHELCGNCGDADEAVAMAVGRGYTIGNGASLAIADGCRRLLIEVAGDRTGIIAGRRAMAHTNHFQSEELKPLNIAPGARYSSRIPGLAGVPVMESSLVRLRKLLDVLPEIVSPEDLRSVLGESDDVNGMNNVFQEGPYWGTICTLIACPSRLTVYRFEDVRRDRPDVHDVACLLALRSAP
jgi:Acyl-coenzyme A:6-aminopenicillanic acid acyl-transferase